MSDEAAQLRTLPPHLANTVGVTTNSNNDIEPNYENPYDLKEFSTRSMKNRSVHPKHYLLRRYTGFSHMDTSRDTQPHGVETAEVAVVNPEPPSNELLESIRSLSCRKFEKMIARERKNGEKTSSDELSEESWALEKRFDYTALVAVGVVVEELLRDKLVNWSSKHSNFVSSLNNKSKKRKSQSKIDVDNNINTSSGHSGSELGTQRNEMSDASLNTLSQQHTQQPPLSITTPTSTTTIPIARGTGTEIFFPGPLEYSSRALTVESGLQLQGADLERTTLSSLQSCLEVGKYSSYEM